MNEQDPLAQLRDIHMPDNVGIWPPAPGWWILAFIVLAGLAFSAFKFLRYRQANRYRHEAHDLLQQAWNSFQQDNLLQNYLTTLTQLLKRTALAAYPKITINTLKGQEWLSFLDISSETSTLEFSKGPGKLLLVLPYQNLSNSENINLSKLEQLHKLSLGWLQKHKPQKEVQKILLNTSPQARSEESSHAAI